MNQGNQEHHTEVQQCNLRAVSRTPHSSGVVVVRSASFMIHHCCACCTDQPTTVATDDVYDSSLCDSCCISVFYIYVPSTAASNQNRNHNYCWVGHVTLCTPKRSVRVGIAHTWHHLAPLSPLRAAVRMSTKCPSNV